MMDFISLGFVGLILAAGVALGPLMLLALAIPYAVVRLRTDGPADSQLGLKVALYFFISASMLLWLSGLSMIAADLLARDASQTRSVEEGSYGGPPIGSKSEGGFNATCRTGLALMISGVLGWVAHRVMAKRTTPVNRTRVHRMFVGFRFAIIGLTMCGTLTLLIVLMLQENAFKRPAFNTVRGVIGSLIVWLPAWLAHLGLFFQASRVPAGDGAESVAKVR